MLLPSCSFFLEAFQLSYPLTPILLVPKSKLPFSCSKLNLRRKQKALSADPQWVLLFPLQPALSSYLYNITCYVDFSVLAYKSISCHISATQGKQNFLFIFEFSVLKLTRHHWRAGSVNVCWFNWMSSLRESGLYSLSNFYEMGSSSNRVTKQLFYLGQSLCLWDSVVFEKIELYWVVCVAQMFTSRIKWNYVWKCKNLKIPLHTKLFSGILISCQHKHLLNEWCELITDQGPC